MTFRPNYTSTAAALCAALIYAAPSFTQETAPTPCNITDQKNIYWAALDETVTLKIQMIDQEEYAPIGHLTLIFEGGPNIDLGQGQKYLDAADPKSCAEHLEAAMRDTHASLTQGYARWSEEEFQDIGYVWSFSVLGQDCMDSIKLPPSGPSPLCLKAAEFRKAHMQALETGEWPQGRYMELVNTSAPLITIRRSADYRETYVYDTREQGLRLIFTEDR